MYKLENTNEKLQQNSKIKTNLKIQPNKISVKVYGGHEIAFVQLRETETKYQRQKTGIKTK